MKIDDKIRRKSDHTNTATIKAFSPDGREIAVVDYNDDFFITTACWWEPTPPPTPEVGDLWTCFEGSVRYRVIGVDEKRGLWHITPQEDFQQGEYLSGDDVEVQVSTRAAAIYTRKLPEVVANNGLWSLKERP